MVGEIDLKLYGDINDINKITKESSVVVMNHSGDVDWLIGWVFSERIRCFRGESNLYIMFVCIYVCLMGAWPEWLERQRSDHATRVQIQSPGM